MDLPTVAQLCAEIPGVLSPLPGQTATLAEQVSAVHVSDLADPTPFLSGGELLLTTGLSLPRTLDGVTEFVTRLIAAHVTALGVGLGPTLQSVPLPLREAADQARLPLLVVPPEGAFLDVSKAYWKLRSETENRELTEAVTAHIDLVRAAFASAPVPAMLRALAQAVHGWAAMVTPSGEIEDVYPSGRIRHALDVAGSLRTPSGSATGAPLTFQGAEGSSVSYPVTLGNRTVGHLVVGTESRLSVNKHRVGLAAASLLTLGMVRRREAQSRTHGRAQAIAMLVDLRLVEAAGRLASRFDIAIGDDVRVVAVDSSLPAVVEQVVREWCPDGLPGAVEQRPSWFLIPSEQPDAAQLGALMLDVDPAASLVVSDAVSLDRVHDVRLSLNRALSSLPAGTVRVLEKQILQTTGLNEALARLLEYSRTDLVGTLVAYLRHRGQWEEAVRELHVHRNTIRHRIGRARELLDVDLDDPDVAAELWLLLRRNGLA